MGEKDFNLGRHLGLKCDEISKKCISSRKVKDTITSNYVFDLNQPMITTECDNIVVLPTNNVAPNGGENISKIGYNEEDGDSKSLEDDEGSKHERKKMRLSMEQATILEDVFKDHNTPNKKQKLDLAEVLNITPRQVEVWFQNRRARTKLKHKEVDVECLKICCETLKEENMRLKRELDDLKIINFSYRTHLKPTATVLMLCPGCDNVRISPSISSTTTVSTLNPFNRGIKREKDIGSSSTSKIY